MLLTMIFLAITVSIDSLGIGITYAVKKTKISNTSKLILFTISFIITTISIVIGSFITNIFPEEITKLIGSTLLIGMGLWIIYQSQADKPDNISNNRKKTKTYNIFFKYLEITIKIIRSPIYSDLDNSKKIDAKESIYLGLALSLDSISVGIGSSIIGFNSFLFPILVSFFQLLFLSIGFSFGRKLINSSKIPDNIWSLISGIILILIGILKFFM